MSDSVYQAANNRYTCGMDYRRAGKSGILLPAISLGLWHNFGDVDSLARSKDKLHYVMPSITALRILTWPTITAPQQEVQKKLSARS